MSQRINPSAHQSAAIDCSAVFARLETAIAARTAEHALHGMAVALVDDQRVVYSRAFGDVREDSIFRAGSISKVFNAVAVMQLVERGVLDLDAPIETYMLEFQIAESSPNQHPITLRQLLCHRSGLPRESPVGGYFDSSQPSLANTVASVGHCKLVNPPNTKARYSNIGPAIAGQIVAKASGLDYVEYQRTNLLEPLGMTNSSFRLAGIARGRLAAGHLRVADGQGGFVERHAPFFDLGTIPAGNLFSSAADLARFVSMLAADGNVGGAQIISKTALDEMYKQQSTDEPSAFGLGFMLGKIRDRKTVWHYGAVYGYSAIFVFVPDAKIGAIVLSNDDMVGGSVIRLGNLACELMLEAKLGEPVVPDPAIIQLPPDALTKFVGHYESLSTWAEIIAGDDKLIGTVAGHRARFIPIGPQEFLLEAHPADGSPVEFECNAAGQVIAFVTKAGQRFERIDPASHEAANPLWKRYVGSYGPSFIPVVISVRWGQLYAMTENLADYRLTPIADNVIAFPPGLYTDEQMKFLTDAAGNIVAVEMANMTLKRN